MIPFPLSFRPEPADLKERRAKAHITPMADKKDPKEKQGTFDLDADKTGNLMPGVTKLLQRKSLDLSKSIPTPPASDGPTAFVSGTSTTLPKLPVTLKTLPSRRNQATQPELLTWDLNALKNAGDPLGQALSVLMSDGVIHALFLAPSPIPGKALPDFVAKAAVQAGEKLSFWKGLKWDPLIIPEVWNAFAKLGVLEFPPPGTVTQLQSHRNLMRSAFGIQAEEHLVLIRIGPVDASRGILALVSKMSVIDTLQKVLPQLHARPSKN